MTTVYVGGIPAQLLTDDVLRQNFQHLGTIQETKIFREKGYGFIKYGIEWSVMCDSALSIARFTFTKLHCICFWLCIVGSRRTRKLRT